MRRQLRFAGPTLSSVFWGSRTGQAGASGQSRAMPLHCRNPWGSVSCGHESPVFLSKKQPQGSAALLGAVPGLWELQPCLSSELIMEFV